MKKKYCEICEAELITEVRSFGRPKKKSVEFSSMKRIISNEGIYYGNRWFCNECWNLIINHKVKNETDKN
jgi:hypothetical protein